MRQFYSRRKFLALTGTATGSTFGSMPASAAGTVSYGDTVEGVTDDQQTFVADGGDVVSIDLRVDKEYENEGELELFDPNGNSIYNRSGNGFQGNAAITTYELPAINGTYTIEISAGQYSDRDSFDYTLSLYEDIPIDEDIGYGETIEGELETTDRYFGGYFEGYHETYAFDGSAGDVVSIEMRPEDRFADEAELALYDPNDQSLVTGQSRGDEGNAVISRMELSQDGKYTIVATSLDDDNTFSYDLSLYEGIPVDQTIEYGDTIEGTLETTDRYFEGYFTGYHDTYAFEGSEGDVVSVEMRPKNKSVANAYLQLYDPNGEQFVSGSTNSGEEGNVVISREELPQDGEYTVVATSLSSADTFSYDLSLYEGIPIDQTIKYGDTIEGTLETTDRYFHSYFTGYHDTYAFEGSEGDVVSVEMRPENKSTDDASLTLYGPNDEEITTESTDSGDGGNTVISRKELAEDGEYTIVATSANYEDTFAYELSFYEGIPIDETLGYGETTQSALKEGNRYLADSSFSGYYETYAFDGSARDVVSVEMRPEDNSAAEARLALLDPNNETVTIETVGDGGNATISLEELSKDGEYTIVAMSNVIDDTFSYTLSLYEGIPTDEEIEYGDVVDRQLGEDDRYLSDLYFTGYHDTYQLQAAEGDIVSIEMRPEDEYENEAKVTLFNPSNEWITRESTGHEGFATIELEKLERDGKYTIVATSSNDDDTFPYELRVYDGIPATDSVDAGETVTGSITNDDDYLSDFDGFYHTYTFGAREGDEVMIEAQPPVQYETDMALRLYDENASQVTSDTHPDDDGIAVIETTIDQPGEYTIVVAAGDANEVDGYELSMEGATDLQPPAVVGSDPPRDLDGDGLYEDVTGNGRFTAADVHALYENRDSDAVGENPAAFDFSGTGGEVSVVDVQALWDLLTE